MFSCHQCIPICHTPATNFSAPFEECACSVPVMTSGWPPAAPARLRAADDGLTPPHAVDAFPRLRVDVHNSLSYSAEQRRLLARARIHGPQEQSRADGQQQLERPCSRVRCRGYARDRRQRGSGAAHQLVLRVINMYVPIKRDRKSPSVSMYVVALESRYHGADLSKRIRL